MNQSDLLQRWKQRRGAAGGAPRITPRPPAAPPRASAGQRRLFLLQRLYPGNRFYQYGHRYTIRGPLDVGRLEAAFRSLLDRQDLLRAYFHGEGTDDSLELRYYPATGFHLETGPADGFFDTPIELPGSPARPLLRVRLVSHGQDQHELLLSLHHIIGDRGAFQLLEHELFTTYDRLARGEAPPPAPELQFADYAYWEAQRTVPDHHYAYWRRQLAGPLPPPPLEPDFARPPRPTFAGALAHQRLGTEPATRLRELARTHATTPNVVFLAAWSALLRRYSGEEDQLVGSPVSLRDRRELEGTIGFFNETVVLRNRVPAQLPFAGLVDRCRSTLTDALERKDVPFDWLVSELRPDRRGGNPPFFQTMLVYNPASEPAHPRGLSIQGEAVDLGSAKFDLTLFVTDRGGDGFDLTAEYATDLFARPTVTALLGYFRTLLADAVTQPATPVGELDYLDAATVEELRRRWFAPEPAPAFPPLCERIAQRAREAPTAPAVTDGATSLSYGDLLERADALAARLLAAGLRPGQPVGLLAARETNTLVGLLGILRAGGAYLPLDPSYPAERLRFMGEDAGAELLVSATPPPPDILPPACRVVLLGGAPAPVTELPAAQPHQPAYFIYTSGSSGQPKGVPITHANLSASTAARFVFYAREDVAAYLLPSSFSFDSSVAGIFWTLASGGKLVLTQDRAEQEPAALGRLIARQGVSHTLMLPSLYRLLLEFAAPADLASLRAVIVAGEACPAELVTEHHRQLPAVRLVNEYGPTEATVWSTAATLTPQRAAPPPIGAPVPGVGNYVLDEGRQLVPPGRPGELYLSGPQLAPGYHNRPELTAERFLPNPYARPGHERLYRTGDRVRYRADGLLDFLGRADAQVKVRGHRVEPAGVSAALRQLPGVTEAITLPVGTDADRRLVSFVTGGGSPAPEASRLRTALRDRLPAPALPERVIVLPDFPRLPNGKVDRTALLAAGAQPPPERAAYAAPASPAERAVAAVWERVLQHRPVGRHDDFFDLGGDSLRSIRTIALVNRETKLRMKPHHIFNHPVLSDLVAVLEREQREEEDSETTQNLVPLRRGGSLPALFCLHSGGGHVFFYQPLATALPGRGERPVYAIQPSGLDGGPEAVPASIEDMARQYIAEMRRAQPAGPYHLLGTCFSNMLIVEMARQLRRDGQRLGRLFVIDSGPGQLEPVPEVPARPLTNLVKLVRDGNWYNVRSALRRRWWHLRRAAGSPVRTQQRQQVYRTVDSLNDIYAEYARQPVHHPLTFIRSAEFAALPQKGHHVPNWGQLAAAGLEVHVVPGTHLGLFAQPQVRGLAAKIDECLRATTT